MKTNIKHLFTCLGVASRAAWVLPALIAVLNLITAGRVPAQLAINSEGANPNAGLIISNNTLYGTAAAGGSSGAGTVFAVNTDGTGFRILHTFNGGSDGANPWAGLILSSNTLYGTAYSGGSSGEGTVFAINTDGTSFTNLYSFTGGGDGANPIPGLILSSNTLYGTTEGRGNGGGGTVFSITLPVPPTLSIITTDAAFGFTNGVFGFNVIGPSGSNLVVQASTDLQTWIPLQTNLFGSGPLYFSDPQSTTNIRRFYRAQLSP